MNFFPIFHCFLFEMCGVWCGEFYSHISPVFYLRCAVNFYSHEKVNRDRFV